MLVPRPPGPCPYRLPRAARRTPPGADLSFAVGFLAGIPATVLAWLCGAGHDPLIGLVVLALTAACVGAVCTPLGALAAALPIWAFDTGFVINRFGTVTLDHRTIPAMVTIALAATAASSVAMSSRRARH